MSELVLVTGGTGKLGPVIIDELLKAGYRVRVLVRTKRALEKVPFKKTRDIELVVGDVTDRVSMEHAVVGVNVVFHLAARLHVNRPDRKMYAGYYDVNIKGTRNLLETAMEENVSRVILFSTISVYGPGSLKRRFYETTPVNPKGVYAVSKNEAENVAREINQKFKNRPPMVTILRLASVYGKHMTGNYQLLVRLLKRGFFFLPGGGSCIRTLIHERDVASASILAARHPVAAGKIYNLTDGYVHTLKDIVNAILCGMGRNAVIMNFPEYPLHLLTEYLEAFCIRHQHHIFVSFFSKMAYMLNKLMENVGVDGCKIQDELGFQPFFDLRGGWHDILKTR